MEAEMNAADPIISAVELYTRPHQNKKYSKRDAIRLGSGLFYIVTFEGGNDENYVHFVYKEHANIKVYQELHALINDQSKRPIEPKMILSLFVAIGFLILTFGLAWRVGTGDASDKVLLALVTVISAVVGLLGGQATAVRKNIASN